MRRRYGSLTHKILFLLSKERSGLSSRIVFKKLEECGSFSSLCVMLSTMVRKKQLGVDGKIECFTCGHPFVCYRISEDGRRLLANYES